MPKQLEADLAMGTLPQNRIYCNPTLTLGPNFSAILKLQY